MPIKRKSILLRLPPQIKRELSRDALSERRSLTKLIQIILESYLLEKKSS